MTGIDRLIAETAAQTPAEAERRKTLHLTIKRARRACQGRLRPFVAIVYKADSQEPPMEIPFSDLTHAERDEIKGLAEPERSDEQ